MAYADYSYYTSGYLLGRTPAVPEDQFLFFEKQAQAEIDRYTFDRLKKHPDQVTDTVKDCCCELVELLYQADAVTQQSVQSGAAGPLESFSNDGQSGKYDLSQSIYTESGKSRKVQEIIYRHLSGTGLMYPGVCR